MKKILFVCHGNICRSPMAEFIMKDLVKKEGLSDQYYIDSAATSQEEIGNDLYPPAKAVLKKHHIPFEYHPARQVKKKDYALFDLILVMDPNNQRNIKRILPQNPEHKIHLLLDNGSIADPWYTGDFEKSYEQIRQGCEIWLERLENSFV